MIKAISSSNFRLTNKNSKSIYIDNYSAFPQTSDTFIKSQSSKNISFSGYKGANGYGTQGDRDALSYRVKLTPEMIKRNMQNASSPEEGVNINYNLLKDEVDHCSQALASALSVSNDYSNVSASRYNEIKEMAPKGAKIWFVGVVPQWGSVLTGSFKRKVDRYCTELTDDIDDIIHTHIFGNVESILNGYNSAHDAFIETLPSLNNSNVRNKYIKALDKTGDDLNTNTAFVCATFNQKRESALVNKSVTIEVQHKAQAMRTGIKTAMNTIGCGLVGITGVDELITQAGVPVLSNIMGVDLMDKAITAVSDEVIKSVAWVSLEHIDSYGNLAKESLSHLKTPNITKLTKKSLINVLHKIR